MLCTTVAGATPVVRTAISLYGRGPAQSVVDLQGDRTRIRQDGLHVGCHADNLAPLRFADAGLRDAPADRIFFAEERGAVASLMMKTFGDVRMSLSVNGRPVSRRDWKVSKYPGLMVLTTAAGSWPGFGGSRPATTYFRMSGQLKKG
jgi:hypothetical protein